MSNTRQFLLPINYDIAKEVYPKDEMVRKRSYSIDEVKSPKQYRQLYANTFAGETSTFYADKLRRRAKHH